MMSGGSRLAATTAAVAIAVAGCGATGSNGSSSARLAGVQLVAYDNCDELLTSLRKSAAAQAGRYGLPGDGPVPLRAVPESSDTQNSAPGQSGQAAPNKATEHSGTNVHEAGADEPDMVKTDGKRIVTIAKDRLLVTDAASRKITGKLDLDREWSADKLLLSGDRALVFLRQQMMTFREGDVPQAKPVPPIRPQRIQHRLLLVDLSGTPRKISTTTVDGSYIDARQTGSVARVVVRTRPRIDFPRPKPGRQTDSTQRNREAIQRTPLEAWLPRYEVAQEGKPAKKHTVPCDRISRTAKHTGTAMLSVLTVDLAGEMGDGDPATVVADGENVYGNGSSLYVTDSQQTFPSPVMEDQRPDSKPRTEIHKFDVRGSGRPRYVASGSVEGSLLNQYSLSEHEGNLRVATTSGVSWRGKSSESTVYVLGQRGQKLTTIGKAGGLGKGERIYAVRFIGATGYVVTFRQVDPLYVLDLRDPRKPQVTGELKITGYSAYLHPAGNGRLIGVGQEANSKGRTLGTQVSLFDVRDPAKPKRLDSYHAGSSSSAVEFEPHAFLYWPKDGTTVIPMTSPRTGTSEAVVLSIGSGTEIRKTGTIRGGKSRLGGTLRSLIIGDTLWTVSADGLRASDKTTLNERAWVPFM